jgi:hypothetical protein
LNADAADLNCDRRGFEKEKESITRSSSAAIAVESAASALNVRARL